MSISFTCSACDDEVKVKDEFAGRKIKCPSCREVVTVPAAKSTKVAAGATAAKIALDKEHTRKRVRDEEEDEEADEQPKKKKKGSKKKAQGGNTGLLIGLCAGGGVLVIALILGVIFMLPGGEKQQAQNTKKESPKEEKKEPTPSPKEEKKDDKKLPPKEKISNLGRQRDLIEYRNYFTQVGIAYQSIVTATNKAPKNKEDIKRELAGASGIMDRLDKGYIQFIYDVHPSRMPKGASNTIVAYEPYYDFTGKRLVIMGDGKVQELTADEFSRAPRADDPP